MAGGPPIPYRRRHGDVPVEAAGAGEGGVQRLRQVGRRQHDDALVRLKPVHLHQQLVQRLPALVHPTTHKLINKRTNSLYSTHNKTIFCSRRINQQTNA